MRLKLDENLGPTVQRVFVKAGHDVETVLSERLSGADDRHIFMACHREKRSLVTLDLDFADPLHFRPRECVGIVVLRARGPVIAFPVAELGARHGFGFEAHAAGWRTLDCRTGTNSCPSV